MPSKPWELSTKQQSSFSTFFVYQISFLDFLVLHLIHGLFRYTRMKHPLLSDMAV